jgi:N-acetylmuramic acid 6-phosphate etherase
MAATECNEQDAARYLEESGKNVKLAICMILTGKDKKSCEQLLEENAGNVSKTIHSLSK